MTDRATQKVALMASSEGGMDIEEVAHATPEKIIKVFVDPADGPDRRAGQASSPTASASRPARTAQAVDVFKKLYTCYMETDASLAEINPLILDRQRQHHRARREVQLRLATRCSATPRSSPTATSTRKTRPRSRPASSTWPTSSLDGNIGCLVNGAGLAMATMDTIKLFGGEPANFLDVGGGATAEKVTEAFKIMLKNPKVEGDPGQHLRRHHEVRHHRRRRDRRLQGGEPAACRWWCA